jgi:hypothetical protein
MKKFIDGECNFCGNEFRSERKKKYCNSCSNSSTRRMIRNREFIKNYKMSRKCEICEYDKYPEILEFHHKNRVTKARE